MFELTGKKALVTGATGGLGEQIARAFHRQGAVVALHGTRREKLESLAHAQKGVQKAYAIQSGREIRVIVRQEDVTDTESFQISRDLAKKIEQELTYPGQIKVTVIRESRYVEYAK